MDDFGRMLICGVDPLCREEEKEAPLPQPQHEGAAGRALAKRLGALLELSTYGKSTFSA